MKHQNDVVFTGHIQRKELNNRVSSARALVFLSFFEGFGIPLVEAMKAKTAILTTNLTAMPEVCGDSALYCSSFDIDDMVEKMQQLSVDDNLVKQLEQKGPQTESDAKRIDMVGAQLGKTTDANKFLLTIAKEQLKRDMEQRNFYDKWWKANKTYDGAEDAWYEGDGGKSLFDRPALKDIGKQADKRKPLDQIFGGKKNG
jgi:hypothetical protein